MTNDTQPVPYKSKFEINPPSTTDRRVSQLIWGPSGCGKTILASTSVPKRLWLQFDPDGTHSIKPDPTNNLVIDLSSKPPSIVDEAKSFSNPFDLDNILKNDTTIRTVIVDSVTAFTTQATAYAAGHKAAPGAVFENPSQSGYGFRNRFALGLCKNILAVTNKHGRHVIFICHEGVPETDKDGVVMSITLLLGGTLPSEVSLHMSEVWNMRDTGTKRMVAVRNVGVRKPMKSRMFDTSTKAEFESTYNVMTGQGLTIESLINKWKDNKYEKIALP